MEEEIKLESIFDLNRLIAACNYPQEIILPENAFEKIWVRVSPWNKKRDDKGYYIIHNEIRLSLADAPGLKDCPRVVDLSQRKFNT